MIALIAAVAENRVIGSQGAIPWHIGEDLALFKRLTTGHTVIMGRKTFESLRKPLPNRRNIVVSHGLSSGDGYEVCRSLEEALKASYTDDEVFLIGGESIYREGLPFADTLYLSMVKGSYQGDTRFPKFDERQWTRIKTEEYPRFTLAVWKKKAGENGS